MTHATNTQRLPLLVTSVFLPVWAGQPDSDAELTFRMEEATAAANGATNPAIRASLSRLEQTFTSLVNVAAKNHFLQIAVQQEIAEGTPIETTLDDLNELVARELAQTTADLLTWTDDAKRRSRQAQPAILAANDLLVNLSKKIDLLTKRVGNADVVRSSAEEKYRAVGMNRQQIDALKVEPTFQQVEDMKFELKGLDVKRRLVSSFLGDYPRWRVEKLQGVELPTLAYHQEKQVVADKRVKP